MKKRLKTRCTESATIVQNTAMRAKYLPNLSCTLEEQRHHHVAHSLGTLGIIEKQDD
jgi:hypothetical protein